MARCCGCGCSVTSPPSATANRCPFRVRTGGCSRSSPCTPARTSATRWPPASGPTSRPRANLRTAWQLAEDGDGTGITLRVTAAEPKASVLDEKRPSLAASVVALAALAEREHGPAG